MITTVLIANRGEIARRVIRSCQDAGLRTVAVHSAADADAAHVHEADVAVPVDSYLDATALLAAAAATGADAIHPGYGFLSENADFARSVHEAGIAFIGPSADVIEVMGRKDRARLVAEEAAVPVTPRHEPDAVPADAYPVLVKAAAGGGGKGMHVVRRAEDLPDALARAAREATSAFGDDTLLVETYLEGGRHVEVQVFGDQHGRVVHLFTRDCSVQRRHQKVLEEAPAPELSDEVRRVLHESSVALAREVGYVGAGTVEFLVRDDQAFFLEMNTRLQVEHPVTEEITGVDLVRWQLAVADGGHLPAQDELEASGHAIEARIYAEDPYAGFLPQAGRIEHLRWPASARVEAAFDEPATVSAAYDPMLAKVVVAGADRDRAVAAMVAALDDTEVGGIATNTGFVRRVVASPEFTAGDIHTGWLDAYDGPLLARPQAPDAAFTAAAHRLLGRAPECDGWRVAGPPAAVRVPVVDDDGVQRWVQVDAATGPHEPGSPTAFVTVQGHTWRFTRPDGMRRSRAADIGSADVIAPMPGSVLSVHVAEGDRVEAGQKLAVLEAMKMEHTLTAPHDGTVTVLEVTAGDQVPLGHLLVHVKAHDD